MMRCYRELFSYIPGNAANCMVTACVLLLIALFFLFRFPRSRWNYLLLFAVTALFGFGFALMDWYLHPWDEQFHALVAKNMANGNPFHPILLDGDCAQLNYKDWRNNRTWLHKQPLFLWQIALSIKLFGANVMAVRIPGILLHALSAVLVLSIAKRYLSYFFAVLAAILFGFSGLLNDYVSGAIGMDHNDVAFIFYVTASFWAWLKYRESASIKWIVLIGIFSGGAVLCKWLTGLVVYAAWGFVVLCGERQLRAWRHLFGSFAIAVLVAAPWQLYCWLVFPKEFAWEMQYNSLHLFEAVEQHTGESLFYWQGMKAIYGAGELLRVVVVIGLAMAWFTGFRKRKAAWLFAAFAFMLVYGFFTLAATKLPGYVLIVSCFGFIFLLLPVDRLAALIRSKTKLSGRWWLSPFIVVLVLLLHFNPNGVIDRHFYRAPDEVNGWQQELTRVRLLIGRDSKSRCLVVEGASAFVVPALRFMTGREIYAPSTGACKECVVIDLQDKRLPIKSAN